MEIKLVPRWWNWYTHTVEGRDALRVRVQIPLEAQYKVFLVGFGKIFGEKV